MVRSNKPNDDGFSDEEIERTIRLYGLKPFTPAKEFRQKVVPMSRTKQWEEIGSGEMKVSHVGRSVGLTGRQAAEYLLLTQRRGQLRRAS